MVEWFGPDDSENDKVLIEAGIKSDTNASILQDFFSAIGALSQSLKVDLALTKANGSVWQFNTSLRWKGWSPQTRRLQKTGPMNKFFTICGEARTKFLNWVNDLPK